MKNWLKRLAVVVVMLIWLQVCIMLAAAFLPAIEIVAAGWIIGEVGIWWGAGKIGWR